MSWHDPSDLPGCGTIIKYGSEFRIWTEYGEFNLPKNFEAAGWYEKIRMVASAVRDGMNRYWMESTPC